MSAVPQCILLYRSRPPSTVATITASTTKASFSTSGLRIIVTRVLVEFDKWWCGARKKTLYFFPFPARSCRHRQWRHHTLLARGKTSERNHPRQGMDRQGVPRVLCLHGNGTSAVILQFQLMHLTKALKTAAKAGAAVPELVFVDGPLPTSVRTQRIQYISTFHIPLSGYLSVAITRLSRCY